MIDELKQEMLAEQAQRLARLELRSRIHMIGLLIWGTLLLGWMIYCFVKLMVMANRTAIMQAGTIPFTCGTCGAAFDLPAEYLVKHPFIPKKSISAGAVGGERASWHGPYVQKTPVPCMREKGMVQTGYAGNWENWRKFFYRSSKKGDS